MGLKPAAKLTADLDFSHCSAAVDVPLTEEIVHLRVIGGQVKS